MAGMLFLLKLAPLAVSMEMLLTLVRIDQIEIYLLFLIEDELFVQICLNQWRKESVTALFLGILRHFWAFWALPFFNSFGYHFEVFVFNGTDMVISGVLVKFIIR